MAQRCIDVYNKMPEKVRKSIDRFKENYRSAKENHRDRMELEIRMSIAGYCKALMDAGLITDRERSMLFILTTT